MSRYPGALVETARVASSASIGLGCVVGPEVVLHAGVTLHPHVVIMGAVEIEGGTEVFPGAIIGKPPARHPTLARPARPTGPVRIGAACAIGAYAMLNDDVVLGEGCLVGHGASIREGSRIGRGCIVGRAVSVHPDVHIGDGSQVLDHTHLASKTVLGQRCFVGVHVVTSSDNALGRLPYDDDRVQGPIVGDDAAIGSGCVILPGVRIGTGAIIGSGSLVTSDVESGARLRGRPAHRVDE